MIFNYTKPSTFIFAFIRQLPKKGHGEIQKMAAHLGFSSTYMSQILADQKMLTAEQALSLAQYLGLNSLDSEYFLLLVQRERAGTLVLKKHFDLKIEEIKNLSLKLSNRVPADKKSLSELEKSIYYSSALFAGIHIYCSTGKSGRSLEEIVQRFRINRARAIEILSFLVKCKLCEENFGVYAIGPQAIHLDQDSPYIHCLHSNWRMEAIQVSQSLDKNELMYSVCVSLSQKDFEKLRESMVVYIQTFLKTIETSPPDDIACFNLDWFWVGK